MRDLSNYEVTEVREEQFDRTVTMHIHEAQAEDLWAWRDDLTKPAPQRNRLDPKFWSIR